MQEKHLHLQLCESRLVSKEILQVYEMRCGVKGFDGVSGVGGPTVILTPFKQKTTHLE